MSPAGSVDYRIHGLDCEQEAVLLRRELSPLVKDPARLSFDFVRGVVSVDVDVPAATVLRAIDRAGLKAEPLARTAPNSQSPHDRERRARTLLTALSGTLAVAGFATHATIAGDPWAALGGEGLGPGRQAPAVAAGLYFAAILCGVRFVLPRAWRSARRLQPDMNLLMTVAVAGAVALGEWFEAASVAFLFSLSLALEAWSIGRARRAISALLDLSPPVARLKSASGDVEQSIDSVPVGAVFVVRPGERIPLDGVVTAGASSVDQAPITGESSPVLVEPTSAVFAGSINGEGALEVRSTRLADDTTLAKIIRLVREAQSKRGTTEQWVDQFARVYTPAVMLVAVGVFLVPPLVAGGAWGEWLYRSLVLLVIACPCALVISTPVTVVAATAAAARAGVLIKGGRFLEIPARLKAIAFDKTGTITEGRLQVESLMPLSGHDESELLERGAALEARSSHPLARAILAHASGRGITAVPAEESVLLPGRGAQGRIGGREFWIGSHRYLEERGQETPAVHEAIERLSESGRSVVVVGNEAHVCGVIALSDRPREGARQVLDRLRGLGIDRLVLLTGDNRATARTVGKAMGFDDVGAELLPTDKVEKLRELVKQYGSVAMVGDGVNDAPALASASIGIAMGTAGSDAAIETADIALMGDDLARLPWLIAHSRRTMSVMRQNIGFALLVKATFVALAFAGSTTLWAAIAADMGASLLVITNGLRLLRPRT